MQIFNYKHNKRGWGDMRSPQSNSISTAKNTGLKKLLKTVVSGDDSHLVHFLKRHYITLEDSVFAMIEEKKKAIIEKLKEDSVTKEIIENADTTVYTYVTAAVEKVMSQNNADIGNKPVSYTSRIIKRNKDKVNAELNEELQTTFKELDIFVENIIPDVESEAVL